MKGDCEQQYDDRYTEGGSYKINEYELLKDYSVAALLSGQSNNYAYSSTNVTKITEFKTWNRPTYGWSLTCEEEGKTR